MQRSDISESSIRKLATFGSEPADRILIAGIAGFTPLMIQHASNLWWRPHLQFFPLAWTAFTVLLLYRARLGVRPSAFRNWGATLALLASLTLGIGAVVAFSPWLCHIATLALLTYWMLKRCTGNHWFELATWLSMVALTAPLPMSLDERLIQQLQNWSSRSASAILDLTRVPHLLLGNVIEVQHGKMFVDQACSGVDSLYALAAVALLLVIHNRRTLIVTVLMLVFVGLWAWFGNVVRLVVIAYLFGKYKLDLTEGWQHTLVGLCTFSLAFAGMYCSQEALASFFKATRVSSMAKTWMHRFYNAIVKWPDFAVETEENQAGSTLKLRMIYSIAPMLVFVLVGVVSIGPLLQVGPWRSMDIPPFDLGVIESSFQKNSLSQLPPTSEVAEFTASERSHDNMLGEFSAAWIIRDAGKQLVLSLDFPFDRFHALEVCYVATGHQFPGSLKETEHANTYGKQFIREGLMVDEFGEASYLYYLEFTIDGKFDKMGNFWKKLLPIQYTSPVFQLQLLVKNCGSLSEDDHLRNRKMLIDAQGDVLPILQSLD